MRYPTASEALGMSNGQLLASGKSADLVQYRKYAFYTFRGDWLHKALPPENRGLTREALQRRVKQGSAAAPGDYGGEYDHPDQRLFRKFVERVGPVTLVDLGANYGHEGLRYALLARDIGTPVRRHVAIEPGHAGMLLPANLVLHRLDDCQIISAALGDTDGVALLTFQDNVTTGGTLTHNPNSHRDNAVPVKLVRWDTLARDLDLQGPTFFKVDIQGGERHFLDSAGSYLTDRDCAGILEFSPSEFGSPDAGAAFLDRFSQHFHLWDVGIKRDTLDPIRTDFGSVVGGILGRDRPYTDLIFYPRSYGAEFL